MILNDPKRVFILCTLLLIPKRVFSNTSNQNHPSSTTAFTDREPSGQNYTDMGQQVGRIMTYDQALNRRNAIPVLQLTKDGFPVVGAVMNVAASIASDATPSSVGQQASWYRLDDGVMGGQSSTEHFASTTTPDSGEKPVSILVFQGMINTDGGGFASIRTQVPPNTVLTAETKAVRLRFRGDGKTYKCLLSDGAPSGPWGKSPSWQADIPTKATRELGSDEWQELTLPLSEFLPNFGGRGDRQNPVEDAREGKYVLDPTEMRQLGIMLSLRLSTGRPNPPNTFGQGCFPFSMHVHSIDFLTK